VGDHYDMGLLDDMGLSISVDGNIGEWTKQSGLRDSAEKG